MALTPEQFEKLKAQLAIKQGITAPKPGFVDRIKQDFSERNQNIVEAREKADAGEQSHASGVYQAIGQTAGAIGDVGVEALMSVPVLGDLIKAGGEKLGSTETVQKAAKGYSEWKAKNPEAAANLEATFNIGALIPAGAVAAKGTQAAAKGVVKGAEITTEAAEAALKNAKKATKGAGEVVGDVMTPIDASVETALNPTRLIPKDKLKDIPMEKITAIAEEKSVKLDKYVKQAQKAVNDNSQSTPLTLAGEKAGESLNIINNKLAKQGELKREALGKIGDRPVAGIQNFRASLRDALRGRLGLNLDSKTGEIVNAPGRVSKISLDPADNKMVKDVLDHFKSLGDKPTVRQVDDAIDAVQDILYKRKENIAIPVNGQLEGLLKEFTGMLNKTVKKVGGEQYRKANDKFAYFVDVRDKLNKALGAEGVRGESLMKQLFGSSGEKSRQLFADIKKLTGIDLVDEATIAKFVMETVGDTRQANLLEQAIKGTVEGKTVTRMILDAGLRKVQDPIGKAKRIISSPLKE